MIYLAVPYSHPEIAVREYRHMRVTQYAARLMQEGQHVFSPITHCHSLQKIAHLPEVWEFWRDYDFKFLAIATELRVLMLDGWKESIGVREELKEAERLNITISYHEG